MKAVKRKLKSRSGASILISLMFMLVIMMVGVVCLVAAYNNSGRATHAKDDLQRYYAVQSAVNLIQEDLKKECAVFEFTQTEETAVTYKVELPDENRTEQTNKTDKPKYGRLVYDLIKSTNGGNGGKYIPSNIQGISRTLNLTVSDQNEDLKVTGRYKIGESILGNASDADDVDFTLYVDLWYDNDGTAAYATSMVFPAYVRTVNVYNAEDETVTTKLIVTWEDPQSVRGKEE